MHCSDELECQTKLNEFDYKNYPFDFSAPIVVVVVVIKSIVIQAKIDRKWHVMNFRFF